VAGIIQYGGQQPLLPANLLPSTLTTSIALPTSSWSQAIPSSTSTTTASKDHITQLLNGSWPLESPLVGQSSLTCPSLWGISSLREYFATWTAAIWRSLKLGGSSPSSERPQENSSRFRNGAFDSLKSSQNRSSASADGSEPREIPQYVLDYAPYCWLFSEEEYWPGLMEEHLEHTTPLHNYEPVPREYRYPDLDNLDKLNEVDERRIYLTSNDDPESYPHWLGGQDNIPDGYEMAGSKVRRKPKASGVTNRSRAPVILIVVEKSNYVDAFWFFFYSFNLGNQVLGVRFGNHVGDWEHTMVRFKKGKPTEVFYSEHEWGAGYTWEDAEKSEKDPKRVCAHLRFLYYLTNIIRCTLTQPSVLTPCTVLLVFTVMFYHSAYCKI
jgi:hypothetical protein